MYKVQESTIRTARFSRTSHSYDRKSYTFFFSFFFSPIPRYVYDYSVLNLKRVLHKLQPQAISETKGHASFRASRSWLRSAPARLFALESVQPRSFHASRCFTFWSKSGVWSWNK